LPVSTGSVDIRILGSLVATAQQQNNFLVGDCVIHPVSCPHINAELPYTIATKLVIAEVAKLDAIYAPIDGNSCSHVAPLAQPVEEDIFPVWGQVMSNFVHDTFSSINELMSNVAKPNRGFRNPPIQGQQLCCTFFGRIRYHPFGHLPVGAKRFEYRVAGVDFALTIAAIHWHVNVELCID